MIYQPLFELVKPIKLPGNGGLLPYIEIGDIDVATKQYAYKDKKSIPGCSIAKKGNVLVSRVRPTRGAVSIVMEDEVCVSSAFTVLDSLDTSVVLNKYVFYALAFKKQFYRYLESVQKGTSYPSCREADILKYKISVFAIAYQTKVVNILETCESAIQKRKEANRLTDEFLKSTFLEMFGDPGRNPKHWRTSIINDAVKFSEYGTSNKSNNKGEGHPVIGMGNITYGGGLDLSKFSYVRLSDGEFNKLKLHLGDIIFNRTNSTELVGKTTYWDQEFDAVIASYLVKLRLKNDFNPIWFSHLLNTEYYKLMFMERCRKAVGQSNISPTLLKQFPMYMPSLSEQQKFADIVQKVEKLKQTQHDSEKELTNLFNSLMQRAFRGE